MIPAKAVLARERGNAPHPQRRIHGGTLRGVECGSTDRRATDTRAVLRAPCVATGVANAIGCVGAIARGARRVRRGLCAGRTRRTRHGRTGRIAGSSWPWRATVVGRRALIESTSPQRGRYQVREVSFWARG
ncbi:hypothetical protein Y027_5103 [Burkholderia pseudomallei TSV5]|nr:hypothetical protein Y027_5103 [Burkholderia pseudomallei TSV5]